MEPYLHFDYLEIVSRHMWTFRCLGLLPSDRVSFKTNWWDRCRLAVTCLFLVPMTISEIGMMCLTLRTMDIVKISKASFVMFCHLVQCFKYWSVVTKNGQLIALLKSINRPEFKPKSEEQLENLKYWVKFTRLLYNGSMVLVISTASFMGLVPFTQERLEWPVGAWYPFDTSSRNMFVIIYLYQAIGMIVNGIGNACWDVLSAALLTVLCSQLQNLNNSLENIRLYNENKGNVADDFANKMLKKCIMQHKCILKFAKETSSIILASIFGEFLIIVIIICLTLFEMASVSIVSIRFFTLNLYLCCMLLELFLSCYFGNEITFQSSKLISFSFQSEWYNCSKDFKQNLLIFMGMCQEDLKFYAGGFLSLSLETFVNILKSSWSYYTLLIKMKDKNA